MASYFGPMVLGRIGGSTGTGVVIHWIVDMLSTLLWNNILFIGTGTPDLLMRSYEIALTERPRRC